METIEMNYGALIFDPQADGAEEDPTINGLALGSLNPNAAKIIGADGEATSPLDMGSILEHFHPAKDGELLCPHTGKPVDSIVVVDGNQSNFLITNLEPANQEHTIAQPLLPKVTVSRVFRGADADIEVELYGALGFRATEALDKIEIPEVPSELGLAHAEAQLLWIWNELTKVQLLKGLSSLKRCNRQSGSTVTLTSMAVLEFTFKMLQQEFTKETTQ